MMTASLHLHLYSFAALGNPSLKIKMSGELIALELLWAFSACSYIKTGSKREEIWAHICEYRKYAKLIYVRIKSMQSSNMLGDRKYAKPLFDDSASTFMFCCNFWRLLMRNAAQRVSIFHQISWHYISEYIWIKLNTKYFNISLDTYLDIIYLNTYEYIWIQSISIFHQILILTLYIWIHIHYI